MAPKLVGDMSIPALESLIRDLITSTRPAAPPPPVSASVSTDTKPILLHDSHRVALESLFGGPLLDTPDDVVRYATRLISFSLIGPPSAPYAPIEIVLPLDTLERLDSRRPLDTTLAEMLVPAIHDFIDRFINGDV